MAKKAPDAGAGAEPGRAWTFLSNHAHVLIAVERNPDVRLRDLALLVGITERAVLHIVADLEAEGILVRERDGRRNHYRLHLDTPLRHPLEETHSVRELVKMLA